MRSRRRTVSMCYRSRRPPLYWIQRHSSIPYGVCTLPKLSTSRSCVKITSSSIPLLPRRIPHHKRTLSCVERKPRERRPPIRRIFRMRPALNRAPTIKHVSWQACFRIPYRGIPPLRANSINNSSALYFISRSGSISVPWRLTSDTSSPSFRRLPDPSHVPFRPTFSQEVPPVRFLQQTATPIRPMFRVRIFSRLLIPNYWSNLAFISISMVLHDHIL